MTVLLVVLVWFFLSIATALAVGACMRVGRGPVPTTSEVPVSPALQEALPAPAPDALAA